MHRSILAVDIEGSTFRTNTVKEELRDVANQLVMDALGLAEIDDRYYDYPFTDRGDGYMVLVNAVPKPLLLSRVVPALTSMLSAHNSEIPETEPARVLRLRAIVHAGEVHYDSNRNNNNGRYGEDVDVACRLLDAPRFKAFLRRVTAPLALLASDSMYKSIIRHGYDGIDHGEFKPLVTVSVGDQRRRGYVHLPHASKAPVRVPPRAQVHACRLNGQRA